MTTFYLKFKTKRVTPKEAARLVSELEALHEVVGENDSVVLEGFSDHIFSAGGDLPFVRKASLEEVERYAEDCFKAVELFYLMPCKTTSVVRGAAVGGGAEAALAADRLEIWRGGYLKLPEYEQGHFPFAGGTVLPYRHKMTALTYGQRVTGPSVSNGSSRDVVPLPPLHKQWARLMKSGKNTSMSRIYVVRSSLNQVISAHRTPEGAARRVWGGLEAWMALTTEQRLSIVALLEDGGHLTGPSHTRLVLKAEAVELAE